MNPEDPVADDALGRVADLIRDVGIRARHARRYRALASTIADPTFDRVLELGSEVRRAARGARPEAALSGAIAELEALDAHCAAAVAEVRQSRAYREAAESYQTGQVERVTLAAPALFTDIAPHAPRHAVYWALPLGGGRSGAHFLPPADCVARIRRLVSDGLGAPDTPPELGGDETIRPVVLSDEHDGLESPIALAFDPDVLPGPLCRIEDGSTVLFYGDRLRALPRIQCLATVDDEWWRTRPDFYREYVDGLQHALQASGLGTTLSVVG